MLKTLSKLAAIAAFLLAAGAANAATLWSNLPTVGGGQAGISTGDANAAMGFSVPLGTDYLLDSVTLSLANASGDTPLVSLFSNSGNNPSTLISTFSNPVLGTDSLTDFVFAAAANTILSANTTYWIVVQSLSGTFNWRRNNPSTLPTGEFSYAGTRFNGNPPTQVSNTYQYGIQLNGSSVAAVPLPASALLLLTGVAGLLMRGRFNMRSTA